MTSITRSITELVPSLEIGLRLADHALFSLKGSPLLPKTIVGFLQSWEVASAFQHLDLLVKTGQLSPHIAKVVEPLLRYSRLCYTGLCLGLVLDISSSTSVIDMKMRKVIRGIFQGIGVASHIVSLTCAVFLIACGKRALGIVSASILLIGLVDRCALLSPKASFRFKNSLQFICIGPGLIAGSSTEKFYSAAMLVSLVLKSYFPVEKLAKVREELVPLPEWDKTHQLASFHVDEFFKQGGPTYCFSANFTHLNYALPSRRGRALSPQEKILFELQDYRTECANWFLSQHKKEFPSLSLEDFCGFGLQKVTANRLNASFEKLQGISEFETYFRTVYKAEKLINRISDSVSKGLFQEEHLNLYIAFWASSLKLKNGSELVANFERLDNREKIKLILFDMQIINDSSSVF